MVPDIPEELEPTFAPGHAPPWRGAGLHADGRITTDIDTDVCIVGGGIAGLSVAYELATAGKRVVLLERDELGAGETGHTTAHLASAVDDRFVEMESEHGVEGAKLIAASHAAAVDRIESIVAGEKLTCDFRRTDGYLFLSPEHDADFLREELQAALRAGHEAHETPDLTVNGYSFGPALRFPRQGRFEPLQYLSGLARAVASRGGRIFTHSPVVDVQHDTRPRVIVENGAHVTADYVVIATNVPIHTRVRHHIRQAAYRTYAMGFDIDPALAPASLMWDTGVKGHGYHYIRIHSPAETPARCILIVGGEDHRTGQNERPHDRWTALESWTRQRFACGQTLWRWSGQVAEPADGVAMIGASSRRTPRILVATGDSGMGITHGVIAGMLIRDIVLERENPWTALYSPTRSPMRGTGEIVKDQLNILGQYLRWLNPLEYAAIRRIKPGSGAIVMGARGPRAVYRAPDGAVHACSAVCPHLAGRVAWNDAEATWDCPCHGSRFDINGEVINGPANKGLERHPHPKARPQRPRAKRGGVQGV